MKNIITIFFVSLIVTSCCKLKKCDPRLPTISLELLDKDSGENLFTNGILNPDSLSIRNKSDQDQRFNVQVEQNRTIIQFSPVQEEYVVNIGTPVMFNLTMDQISEEVNCCSSLRVNNVNVTPYEFEALSDDSFKDWNLIVFIK